MAKSKKKAKKDESVSPLVVEATHITLEEQRELELALSERDKNDLKLKNLQLQIQLGQVIFDTSQKVLDELIDLTNSKYTLTIGKDSISLKTREITRG